MDIPIGTDECVRCKTAFRTGQMTHTVKGPAGLVFCICEDCLRFGDTLTGFTMYISANGTGNADEPESVWMQTDREWFEQHPAETEYTRRFIEGELKTPDDQLTPMMTVVTQMAPGYRERRFLLRPEDSDGATGYVAMNPDKPGEGIWIRDEPNN